MKVNSIHYNTYLFFLLALQLAVLEVDSSASRIEIGTMIVLSVLDVLHHSLAKDSSLMDRIYCVQSVHDKG